MRTRQPGTNIVTQAPGLAPGWKLAPLTTVEWHAVWIVGPDGESWRCVSSWANAPFVSQKAGANAARRRRLCLENPFLAVIYIRSAWLGNSLLSSRKGVYDPAVVRGYKRFPDDGVRR